MADPISLSPSACRPSLKRSPSEAFDTHTDQVAKPKRKRLEHSIDSWLATSCRPARRAQSLSAQLEDTRHTMDESLISVAATEEMSLPELDTTSKTSIDQTSGSAYRESLANNNVHIDVIGNSISEEIKTILDTKILKNAPRSDSAMADAKAAVGLIPRMINAPELTFSGPYMQDVFLVQRMSRTDIACGGNTPWSRTALPVAPDYTYQLVAPGADFHVGYSTAADGAFTTKQRGVIDHEHVRGYTRPGAGNALPFLIFELKSEACGGTTYHAENQAAGAGASTVRSAQWLFKQAKIKQTPFDVATFSIVSTVTNAILYINWSKPQKDDPQMDDYYMSKVKSFDLTEESQMQSLHCIVENIVKWSTTTRLDNFKKIMDRLFLDVGS